MEALSRQNPTPYKSHTRACRSPAVSLSLSLSLFLYIYIDIYIYIDSILFCIYIYIDVDIDRHFYRSQVMFLAVDIWEQCWVLRPRVSRRCNEVDV